MKFKLQILIFFLLSISYGQNEIKQAYFASGCFWCVESIFESLEGVLTNAIKVNQLLHENVSFLAE